jgi:hypothetical protein
VIERDPYGAVLDAVDKMRAGCQRERMIFLVAFVHVSENVFLGFLGHLLSIGQRRVDQEILQSALGNQGAL